MQCPVEGYVDLYIHSSYPFFVHRNTLLPIGEFLIINQLDTLISQIYFWIETLHVSDSSSAWEHDQDGTVFHPDPARKLSANLYDIHHCCVYSKKLLMMDRGTLPNFCLFYVFLYCSMYCLFCVVLCIVCVYMSTELLPPGGYPVAVKCIISYHYCFYYE